MRGYKAPGPDCVTPVCLKYCADQLSPIFTKIFNRSLELCKVPSCFKCSTIIPIPKKSKITGLQACGSNICGHEVIWKTGAGPPEGHHWTLAGSSSVCLQSKQVCILLKPQRIIGTTLPTPQELYLSRVSKRAGKITLDPSHPAHAPSLNSYHLVDATQFWAPERTDTGTVSSLRQSISCTLDNNYGTHTIYTLIYLSHILSLHFSCTLYTCTYKTVYCIYLHIQLSICILYIVIFNSSFYYICFFVLSLSSCCTPIASVMKTNSSYA